MVLSVCIQKIRPGKMEEARREVTPRYQAAFERLGFPPGKAYWSMAGTHDTDTVITLTEWESLAAMEAAYTQFQSFPEREELAALSDKYIESTRWELYFGFD